MTRLPSLPTDQLAVTGDGNAGDDSRFTGVAAMLLARAVAHADGISRRWAGERPPLDVEALERRRREHADEWAAERAARADEGPRAAAQLDTSRTYFLGRGVAGTSCYHSDAGEAVAILADDVGAHVFRREVAGHLLPVWPRRADALLSCGEAGARCDCADCGTEHVLPYRCGARSCPTCAHTAAAIACEKVARRAERALDLLGMAALWEGGKGKPRRKGWKLVTLTTRAKGTEAERYDPAVLRAYVLEVRRAVGPFWRSTCWGRRVRGVSATKFDAKGKPKRTQRARRDTIYVAGIEVAPGGMVHVHLAVYGEYVPTVQLRALWRKACDVGGFVNVRAMRAAGPDDFRKALREVLKYVSKGDKEPGQRSRRAAIIEAALRGVRRVEMGGALRMVPKVTEKDVATHARVCESCGGGASWRWRGMRAPAYVRENRGFGLVRSHDAEDVRLRERAHNIAAAEYVEYAISERKPGGLFYGGAPPPWIDGDELLTEWVDPVEQVAALEDARRAAVPVWLELERPNLDREGETCL